MSAQDTPTTTTLGVPSNEPKKTTNAEVQILDRPVLARSEEGERIVRQFEVMREGEVVKGPGGHSFQVVRNELGYLYLKSVDGQLGVRDMSVEEFIEAMAKAIDPEAALRGMEFMSMYDALTKVDRKEFEAIKSRFGTAQEIQPLFDSLFTEKARKAIQNRTTTHHFIVQYNENDVRKVALTQFATIHLTDQRLRNDAIEAIAAVINKLAEQDRIVACARPLSSLVFASFDSPRDGKLNVVEMATTPLKYAELIFLYVAVKVDFTQEDLDNKVTAIQKVQAEFPGIFVNEWEVPAPWEAKEAR